jgi:hypothetical protein
MGKCGETQTRHGAVVFILIGIIPMTNLDGNELSFC